MKLIRTYLLEDGTMPLNLFGGGNVKPTGKSVDVWSTVDSPRAFYRGIRPTINKTSADAYQLHSNGDLVRVNIWDVD